MGRKGIGKLAPFGICKRIEVWSAGGPKTDAGYEVSHFFMDFDEIAKDEDASIPLEVGSEDRSWHTEPGTKIRLSQFLAKRVPDEETFIRQLASRFTFARTDFDIFVHNKSDKSREARLVGPLDIPLVEATKMDLSDKPVPAKDGKSLPVSGWLAMAKDPYKYDEAAGVRIYARGKIVGVTRDFEQPAGFTGEFTLRSYLVGQVVAEWLDEDEDLIRTDRQDILWDSEYGEALREWGANLIREIAKKTQAPRREKARDVFMKRSSFLTRAKERFGSDASVEQAAIELAKRFSSFAAEDELEDMEYVDALTEFILSVAPHHALINAFREFAEQVTDGSVSIENLLDIFQKARIAELASYGQVALGRLEVLDNLGELIDNSQDEHEFQELIASATWLIAPSWTVITQNQALKTFKDRFESDWSKSHDDKVVLAISHQDKRPDFTLVSIDSLLHIVEIKKPGHAFGDDDFTRLHNYAEAFKNFFEKNAAVIKQDFPKGWIIDLVADSENINNSINQTAYKKLEDDGHLVRISWDDFLARARKVHEEFLKIRDEATRRASEEGSV